MISNAYVRVNIVSLEYHLIGTIMYHIYIYVYTVYIIHVFILIHYRPINYV